MADARRRRIAWLLHVGCGLAVKYMTEVDREILVRGIHPGNFIRTKWITTAWRKAMRRR
jgi:hypothetical protein